MTMPSMKSMNAAMAMATSMFIEAAQRGLWMAGSSRPWPHRFHSKKAWKKRGKKSNR